MKDDVKALVERLQLHRSWRDSHGELNDAPASAISMLEAQQREIEGLKIRLEEGRKVDGEIMAQYRADLHEVGTDLIEAVGHISGIADHFADRDQATGHSHTVPGIWDNDVSNGDMAGKTCDWCARWSAMHAFLAKQGRGG